MKNFFSEIFLNHVTIWCQITNTENIILEFVNLVSSTTENIFNTFLIDESTIFLEKRGKKFAVNRGSLRLKNQIYQNCLKFRMWVVFNALKVIMVLILQNFGLILC